MMTPNGTKQSLRAIIWVAVSTKTQAADERDSLPTQEADARAMCDRSAWQVVDVLRVPGHSRRYIDIHKCASDMRAEGIDAFDRLLAHWEAQDFDVLVVRDGDRFARTQSLHAYIVETTISIGAQICSLADGLIDENNYRMWIAMGGYRAAGEIDSLMKKRQIGYDARARRGLPVNSKVVASHKLLRDPHNGRAVRIVLDETRAQEWLDLAALILEGIAWKDIDGEMWRRFGHGTPLNEAYQPHHYYRIVNTPSFWGHSARHFKESPKGAWIREPGHPVPDGVLMVYNVFAPAYSGDLADLIKAEMTRRENTRGSMSPKSTGRFSGLFICGACGFKMSYFRSPGYVALRCSSRYEQSPTRPDCTDRNYLNEKHAQAYINARLREMLLAGSADAFIPSPTPARPDAAQQTDAVRQQISAVEQQIQRMILKQASAADGLHDQYDQAIANAGTRLTTLKTRLKDLEQASAAQPSAESRQRTYRDIAAMTLDAFWSQDDRSINQQLTRLLGKRCFVAKSGTVVGVADAPTRRNRRY